MTKLKDSLKEYECFSCGYVHSKVECYGIYYCPNALCLGCGGAWFRSTLDSYEDSRTDHTHTVDEVEWLEKGIAYNKANGIDRSIFMRSYKSEISPCPFCDEKHCTVQQNCGDFFVKCSNCGAQGPVCHGGSPIDDDKAKGIVINQWNREKEDGT